MHVNVFDRYEDIETTSAEKALLWFVSILEITSMFTLAIIAGYFLVKNCRSQHKIASFITKLLWLVEAVAITGLLNGVRSAPFWGGVSDVLSPLANVLF